MDISYREVANTLLRLGYRNESDRQQCKFVHENYHSEVTLPLPKTGMEEFVPKALFVSFTYIMAWKGVLKHIDDFAKMVEADRQKVAKPTRMAKAAHAVSA